MIGGALAGAVVSLTFFNAGLIVPAVFYGLFALAGALYGVFAGLGIHRQIAAFDSDRIVGYTLLVATGFTGIAIAAFTLHQIGLLNIFVSAFVLPPIAGIVCGRIARSMIASAAHNHPMHTQPGWMWAAAVYSPSFFIASVLIGALVASVTTLEAYNLVVSIPGALAGAFGGLISGALTAARIDSALGYAQGPRSPQTISAGAHGSLEIVPDAEVKAKSALKLDLPLPETPRQWRMVGLAALIVFLGAGGLYSIFPNLDLGLDPVVQITPTYYSWIEDWDRLQPVYVDTLLQSAVPGEAPIQSGSWVHIIGATDPQANPGQYIVRAGDGRVGYAWYWQLSPMGAVYEQTRAAVTEMLPTYTPAATAAP
jgi:hypothetical protein